MICTTPMCSAGKASVEAMQATFNQLLDEPKFDRTRFESTVESIAASFAASYSWYDPLIPFNPVCCAIETIGKQADATRNEMLVSVGAEPAPGPSTPPSGFDMQTLLLLAGATLLIVYAGPIKDALK